MGTRPERTRWRWGRSVVFVDFQAVAADACAHPKACKQYRRTIRRLSYCGGILRMCSDLVVELVRGGRKYQLTS